MKRRTKYTLITLFSLFFSTCGFAADEQDDKKNADQVIKVGIVPQFSAERINKIQLNSDTVVDAIDQIGKIVQSISHSQGSIGTALVQQSSSTRELSKNIHDSANSTGAIDQNPQPVQAPYDPNAPQG